MPRTGIKKTDGDVGSLSLVRGLHSLHTLCFEAQTVLLVDDCKQGVASAPEVSATAFFETFDDTTTALLHDTDVSLTHREILPLDEAAVLEVALSFLESLHFLAHAPELVIHLHVVVVQILFVILFDHEAQIFDLALDGGCSRLSPSGDLCWLRLRLLDWLDDLLL